MFYSVKIWRYNLEPLWLNKPNLFSELILNATSGWYNNHSVLKTQPTVTRFGKSVKMFRDAIGPMMVQSIGGLPKIHDI